MAGHAVQPFLRKTSAKSKSSVPHSRTSRGTVTSVQLRTCSSTPEGIRTPNLWLRRPLLYPVELRAQVFASLQFASILVASSLWLLQPLTTLVEMGKWPIRRYRIGHEHSHQRFKEKATISKINSIPSAVPGKPAKPSADFPLIPHATDLWCKKIEANSATSAAEMTEILHGFQTTRPCGEVEGSCLTQSLFWRIQPLVGQVQITRKQADGFGPDDLLSLERVGSLISLKTLIAIRCHRCSFRNQNNPA